MVTFGVSSAVARISGNVTGEPVDFDADGVEGVGLGDYRLMSEILGDRARRRTKRDARSLTVAVLIVTHEG
jgi:hypothetical protein